MPLMLGPVRIKAFTQGKQFSASRNKHQDWHALESLRVELE